MPGVLKMDARMAEASGAIDTSHRLQQRCELVFRDAVVTGKARGDAVLRRLPELAVVALRNDSNHHQLQSRPCAAYQAA